MIQVELRGDRDGTLRLGDAVTILWSSADPTAEVRVFARHQGLRYLKPISDWTRADALPFFPEAPGRYVLVAQWRTPAGAHGQAERDLEVSAGARFAAGPALSEVSPTVSLWTPSEWEARVLAAAEHTMLDALEALVTPGDTIYDVGANVGLYATRLAHLTGARGRVYCFEANPVCVSYLQSNVARAGLDNVEILPVAVLDKAGEAEFTIHYGNAGLGLTDASPFYHSKLGHEIRVRCTALDLLIEEFDLRKPQLIKIDIEGAEAAALRGMQQTLASERPTLVLELHGAGNATASLAQLDPLGYRYTDPVQGRRFDDGKQVVEAFGNAVFQIVASAR